VDDQIARSLHHDWKENADGTVTVTTSQDVEKYLRNAAELREMDAHLKGVSADNGMHLVGTIPPVVVQMWRDQGFDVLSPKRSNMTPEEHERELLRRLCGDFVKLNTSRFGRLT